MHNGLFMYSQTSPRKILDDIGWKAPPAIIPHLGREGNLTAYQVSPFRWGKTRTFW